MENLKVKGLLIEFLSVKVVFHPLFESHYPTSTVECPDRVKRIREEIEGLFPFTEPSPASEEEILLVHSPRLLQEVKAEPGLFEVAKLAAGAALEAARIALEGEKAFALCRPPGHHARRDYHWGFCFFNNMAIAIAKVLKDRLITRATVLDIDLHYGDGTADIFADWDMVKVVNIQEEDRLSFLRRVEGALEEAQGELLGVSAGFDRYILDWGRTLKAEDYRTIGRMIAQRGLKTFAVLEGGYYLPDLGKVVREFLEGLEG